MPRRKDHDTDTLTRVDPVAFDETRLDPTPDAETTRFDPADAETHRMDPRVWAPLRVCPQCSLAWETSGEWCPSCGTAFDKTRRESSTPTRVMPRQAAPAGAVRRPGEPPLNRSARKRGVAAAQPAPQRQSPPPKSGSGAKVFFTVVLFIAAIAIAFFAGVASRPSNAQIDRSTAQAVTTAKQSAANSFQRAFNSLEKKYAAAKELAAQRALEQGRAQGQQDAQQQLDAQGGTSIWSQLSDCVVHGQC